MIDSVVLAGTKTVLIDFLLCLLIEFDAVVDNTGLRKRRRCHTHEKPYYYETIDAFHSTALSL